MMIITDLDGTLLNNNNKVSPSDRLSLKKMGDMGIVRVAATGRSLFSISKVLEPGFPIDYVIFNTGAGLQNFRTKEIIYADHLSPQEVSDVSQVLIAEDAIFTVHPPVPDTHCFSYYQTRHCDELSNLLKKYPNYTSPLQLPFVSQTEATLIRAILPNDVAQFDYIASQLPQQTCIRATSPINKINIWLEVYKKGVSKSKGVKQLCSLLNIAIENTVCLGNDYNDTDMLDICQHSFVVQNTPAELKNRPQYVVLNSTNEHSPITELLNTHIAQQN